MYKKHPCFQTPSDSTKIWRYMDFSKLLSLLDRSELYFPSALALAENDPYEGSYARRNLYYNTENDPYFKDKGPKVWKEFKELKAKGRIWTRDLARRGFYINSWYMSEHESAAMWKCYTESRDGIAIQSTVGRLKAAIKKDSRAIYIGKITYIDYEVSEINEDNLFWNFIHKRKSFEHEKELRAIFMDKRTFDPKAELEKGQSIAINIDELVEEIFVSPTTPNWTKELLESILKKYEKGNIKVKKSDLESNGIW